jgi:hypothetical protein
MGVRPAQARKMDVFSLGMLFLWLIFERYFSKAEPLPKGAEWASSSFEYEGKNRLRDILEDLKKQDHLVQLSHQLLIAENDLDLDKKQRLKHFFTVSLASDSNSREADIEQSLKYLDYNW